jgi:hypothetical protein
MSVNRHMVRVSPVKTLLTHHTLLTLLLVSMTLTVRAQSAGNALRFDHTNDLAAVSSFTGFPATNITVEFWMKSSDTTNNGTPFSYATTNSANAFLLYNYRNFQLTVNGTVTTTGVSANDNNWHHIAASWQSSNGAIKLYKDGNLVYSATNRAAGQSLPSGGYFALGQEQDSLGGTFDPAQAFRGDMDEFRIWNTVRSQSEIQLHRSHALLGNETNLVAYWSCEDAGSTLTDFGTADGLQQNAMLSGLARVASTAPFLRTYFVINLNDSGSGSLRRAIERANDDADPAYIDASSVSGTVTLSTNLPPITNAMTICGSGISTFTVSGSNLFRVFFVHASNEVVTIKDLSIVEGRAKGGDGGDSGGGGAGMGGALFVDAGTVVASGLLFTTNVAMGGNGGSSANGYGDGGGGGGAGGNGGQSTADLGGGGGGGFAGNGGDGSTGGGGGGGVTGKGGNGTSTGAGGGGGAFTDGADGSAATGGVGGTGGGGEGGDQVTSGSGSGSAGTFNGGGGGAGSLSGGNANGGAGGYFGGGGGGNNRGTSGAGGDFGGGGGSGDGRAGNGGFGGGGGGGSMDALYAAGDGGFGGGGGGGTLETTWGNGGEFGGDAGYGIYGTAGSGGGGAALGGAIFVRGNHGAHLVLLDCDINASGLIAGAAGLSSSSAPLKATAGKTAGSAMFFRGGTHNFSATGTHTIAGSISDSSNAPVTFLFTGGNLRLTGANTIYGTLMPDEGTLTVVGSVSPGSVSVLTTSTLAGDGTISTVSLASGATISPGEGIGRLTTSNMTWNTNGRYQWQVRNALGAAAIGYDSIKVNGQLDLVAANKFYIDLWTLASSAPDINGNANFDPAYSRSWTLVQTTGGIVGFNPANFFVITTPTNGTGGFSNPLHGGTFTVTQSGTNLLLKFVTAAPLVTTLAATGITASNATLNGSVTPNGSATRSYFEYGLTTNYGTFTTTNQSVGSGTTPVSVNFPLINVLAHATTYHYRVIAENGFDTARGANVTFTTPPLIPSVVTMPASNVTITAALLTGSANPNGGSTGGYFQYGTTTNYGVTSGLSGALTGKAVLPFTNGITGLTGGTLYHFRAVATNSAGTNFGDDFTFTTLPTGTPSAITLVPSKPSATNVWLPGWVGPNGLPTVGYFEYGLTTNYGLSTVITNMGSGGGQVPCYLSATGLVAGTLYHFRVVASNSAAVVRGADVTFMTSPFGRMAELTGVAGSLLAWGDCDTDGWLDLALSGESNFSGYLTEIWRNAGGGSFSNLNAGLEGIISGALAWGDCDNDGDLDLLLAGYTFSGFTQLWRNNGDGTFVTNVASGLPYVESASAAWGDCDNDGDLDLFLSGQLSSSNISRIYRNNGTGAFTNSGIVLPGIAGGKSAWGDHDNDGDLDLLFAGSSSSGRITKVFRNDGPTFTDIDAGLPGINNSSLSWGDFDQDGDLDIALAGSTNGVNSGSLTRVYRNDGSGVFTDIAAGLTALRGGSITWGDYDSDGYSDLFLCGIGTNAVDKIELWRNRGNGTFTLASTDLPSLGFGAVAWADVDNDGRLDVVVSGGIPQSILKLTEVWKNFMVASNTPPSAPSGLTTVTTGNGVLLSWNASSDAQNTNAASLTYNLRVGTTPGGTDIVAPAANLTSGLRHLSAMGNVQHGTNAWLTNINANVTYYWSVQAVDATFAGSVFSAEGTFGAAPPSVITAILPQPSGGYLLQFSGAAGSNYTLQVATDLNQWSNLTTLPAGAGSFQFTDTTNLPTRYYRLKSP